MDTFSFEQLDNAQPLEISDALQAQVQSAAEDSFPDDVGVSFTITYAALANDVRYVEVSLDPSDYDTKFIFELKADHSINKCYELEDGRYTLLFS